MRRDENPFGSTLLDQSKANPASVNMAIFEKNSSSGKTGQGAVSSNYLQQCREDNPDSDDSDSANSVSLSNCRITTDPEKLTTDQPFEMAVDIKGPDDQTSGAVTFNLFCCTTDADGNESCQDQSSPSQGTILNGMAKAKGTLTSPKDPVAAGTKLNYYVVSEHAKAAEKAESPKVEVEAGKPPRALAVWSLGAVHFGFDSSFVLPSAAEKLAELNAMIDQHCDAAIAVFGHADPVGDDDYNKKLSGRRAYAVYCLLSKHSEGWIELSKGAEGDKWELKTTQTILSHLKAESGSPYYDSGIDGASGPKTEASIKAYQKDNGLQADGVVGSETKAKLYQSYMADICTVDIPAKDFLGDPSDEKRQWACSGCSEFNPVLVFSKDENDKFRSSSDKSERDAKNSVNRRTTVFLFPESAKSPGNVTFPCPAWSDDGEKCKAQLFDDADTRRNPSDAERTWEKDKDTFACKFYAKIADEKDSATMDILFYLHDERHQKLPDTQYELIVGSVKRTGQSDSNGRISELGLPALDEATIRWNLASPYNPPTTDINEIERRIANPSYLFQRKLLLFKPSTDQTLDCENMLYHLGYINEVFAKSWLAFQLEYGFDPKPFPDEDTVSGLKKIYHQGTEPTSPKMDNNSETDRISDE